jgi:DNA polymerase
MDSRSIMGKPVLSCILLIESALIAVVPQVKAEAMEGFDQRQREPLRPGEIAGALAWWREAGVDLDFTDAPHPWLAAAEPEQPLRETKSAAAPIVASVAAPLVGGDPASWPRDLAAFQNWWLTEPSLDDGAPQLRVPPRGRAGAALMIVVGHPEADDGADLLSGPEGRLLEAILGAMAVGRDAIYLASALPRHMPLPDWAALSRSGLGAVLRHHVALVAPQRVLVFGSGVLSLLGNDPAQSAQNSSHLYHEGQSIALLAARELGSLARPAWKARFWRDWLDWTGTAEE